MAKPVLTAKIKGIHPDDVTRRKQVDVEWAWTHDAGRTVVLNDHMAVPGDATDEDIIEVINERKPGVAARHPLVEMTENKGLKGKEL